MSKVLLIGLKFMILESTKFTCFSLFFSPTRKHTHTHRHTHIIPLLQYFPLVDALSLSLSHTLFSSFDYLSISATLNPLLSFSIYQMTARQITMEMMKCMRANEYYDIMTAGTEEKYDAAEKATVQLES